MEYTQNYQLPLWDKEDSVLRTDFNENNRKIDAALNRSRYREYLQQIITSEDTEKLSIDLTGVDRSKYWALEIYIEGICDSGCYTLLNNAAGAGYYKLRTVSGTDVEQTTLGHISVGTTEDPKRYISKMTLYWGATRVNAHVEFFGANGGFQVCAAEKSGVTSENLTELTLCADNDGVLKSGFIVTIYGICR